MPKTWGGGGTGNLASTAGNWVGGVAPVGGDALTFDGTSSKDCTMDLNGVTLGNIVASNYTGTITGNGGTYGAADFTFGAATKLTLGVGSAWNVSGNWDHNNLLALANFNMAGATLNLTGVGKDFGQFPSNSSTPTAGVLNIAIGASYAAVVNGAGFDSVDLHIYGTLSGEAEINSNRNQQTRLMRWYLESTGTISGNGEIIFCKNSQFLRNDGTITLLYLSTLSPDVTTVIAPNLPIFGCRLKLYRQGSPVNQSLVFQAGTYGFKGIVVTDDVPTGTVLTLDNSAGAIITIGTVGMDLTSGEGGVAAWITGVGGKVIFGENTTVKCNGLTIDTVQVASGKTLTLAAALFAKSLNHVGGTIDPATFNQTYSLDAIVTSPAQFTANGLNGSTLTVRGSFRPQGVNGTPLLMNASADWTLNVKAGKGNTANADYVNFAHCNSVGETVQAVNCTNGTGNTGNFNFSAAVGTRKDSSRLSRSSGLTLAAGVHTGLPTLNGSSLALAVDSPTTLTSVTETLNQTVKRHGVCLYFDGTNQLVPIDNYSFPDPTAVPPAPTALSVTSGALATWTGTGGPLTSTTYYLERKLHADPDINYTVVGSAISAFLYQGSVPAAGQYDYRVRGHNSVGYGVYSNVYTITYVAITPADYSPHAWYRPLVGGLFQDVARTLPASSNADPVANWDDSSTHARPVQNSDNLKRGSLVLSARNGKPAVQFSGSLVQLINTTFDGFASISSCTIYAVGKFLSFAPGNQFMFGFDLGATNSYKLGLNPEGSGIYIGLNVGATIYAGLAPYSDTGYHIFKIRYDGSLTSNANRLKFFIDGVEQTLAFGGTVPASLTFTNGIALGLTANAPNANCIIGEFLAFAPGLDLTTQEPNIDSYLASATTGWNF